MTARGSYYNEFDPYAAAWLRNLITAGHLPAGDVDERSIVDVQPDDLAGYRQCHFFAGIGGWPYAARLAGWPDDRELWSGSLPCQPYSVAGKQLGHDDERDLWHHQLRLVRARRPLVFVGEQVAAAIGKHWLDRLFFDLSAEGYAGRGAVIPACAVNAPHRRDRIFVIADHGSGPLDYSLGSGLEGFAWHDGATGGRTQQDQSAPATSGSAVADADLTRAGEERAERRGEFGWSGGNQGSCNSGLAHSAGQRLDGREAVERSGRAEGERGETVDHSGHRCVSPWGDAAWIIGHDGKARRVEPGIRLLANGVPARVGKLRAFGNAIVPQIAAEVIGAYMDCRP